MLITRPDRVDAIYTMAWIGAHFSIGMACGGAIAAGVCVVRRRGWKSVPFAMLAGGLLAVAPDLPRTIRQDLPGTMFAQWFGSHALEHWLEARGNWFFFHAWLDEHYAGPWNAPRWGLRGLALVIAAYNIMVYALFRANDKLAAAYEGLQTHIHYQQSADVTLIDLDTADEQPSLRLVGTDGASRRQHERIAHRAPVAAVAMDVIDRATQSLEDAALIDVSDGGLALSTTTPVASGQLVLVRGQGKHLASGEPVRAMVLEQLPFGDRYKLRCHHEAGPKPTRLAQAA